MKQFVLIGEKYCPCLEKAFIRLGFDVIPVPDNPNIDPRVSGHADLSVFYDNEGNLFAADYLKNTGFCEKTPKNGLNLKFIGEKQDYKYPYDAQLNVCLIGNHFIYNPKSASAALIGHLKKQGREGIECRQGYTRCSVCVVDEKSLITSDSGIAAVCRNAGMDVLEILPGYVCLDGFEYGFIGGASINLSGKLIAFTGKLSPHPQIEEIISFIKSRDINIVYLSDIPAFDIGSGHVIKI